jgi:hypothetical protein
LIRFRPLRPEPCIFPVRQQVDHQRLDAVLVPKKALGAALPIGRKEDVPRRQDLLV